MHNDMKIGRRMKKCFASNGLLFELKLRDMELGDTELGKISLVSSDMTIEHRM